MSGGKLAAIAFRNRLLNFWFSNNRWSPENQGILNRQKPAEPGDYHQWFMSSKEFDLSVKTNFETDLDLIMNDVYRYEGDIEEPQHLLACIIALDQFPRNIYRRSSRAFVFDSKAKQLSEEMIQRGIDKSLPYVERTFIYMPFEHSENIDDQNLAVQYFEELSAEANQDPETGTNLKQMLTSFVGYAEKHRKIIQQFGRFPHRNAVLNRQSTPQEEEYLQNDGERFGQ